MNSVLISSHDTKPLIDFYTRIFGQPVWSQDGFNDWKVGNGYVGVGPHDKISGNSQEPARVMFFLETDEVQNEFDRIKNLGAKVISEPYHPDPAQDMWIATLADPDGNYFQLCSRWRPELDT